MRIEYKYSSNTTPTTTTDTTIALRTTTNAFRTQPSDLYST